MTREADPAYWIAELGLQRHPEGGWFCENYRSREEISPGALPARFHGPRSCATSIYFLLTHGDVSALHRLASDEIWYFHAGHPLTIHTISPDGEHVPHLLGTDLRRGHRPQLVVPWGTWFGAEVEAPGTWALVGCSVAPGFDFADFEMADRRELLHSFPAHANIIRHLTR